MPGPNAYAMSLADELAGVYRADLSGSFHSRPARAGDARQGALVTVSLVRRGGGASCRCPTTPTQSEMTKILAGAVVIIQTEADKERQRMNKSFDRFSFSFATFREPHGVDFFQIAMSLSGLEALADCEKSFHFHTIIWFTNGPWTGWAELAEQIYQAENVRADIRVALDEDAPAKEGLARLQSSTLITRLFGAGQLGE